MAIIGNNQNQCLKALEPVARRLEEFQFVAMGPMSLGRGSEPGRYEYLVQKFAKPELQMHAEVMLSWTAFSKTWKLSVGLFRDFRSAYFEVLLPQLQPPRDPALLTFRDDDNGNLVLERLEKCVGSVDDLLAGQVSPILRGELWINGNLPLPER